MDIIEKRKRQRETDRKYYYKHHDKQKEKSRTYQRNNKEKKREYDKKYLEKHRQEKREYYKKYRQEHPEYVARRRKATKKRYEINLRSWNIFFSHIIYCELCGKDIKFNSGDKRTSINFDHRNGGAAIIKNSPSIWLMNNKRTLENEMIWKLCDFGALCHRCNILLPTKNRLEWFKKVLTYIKKRRSYNE